MELSALNEFSLMILVCPECSTRYLMSASAIGEGGRDVRCAKCDHQWFQDYEAEEFTPQAEETFSPDLPGGDSFISMDNLPDDEDVETDEGDSKESEETSSSDEPLEEEAIPDSVKPLPEGSNVPAHISDVVAVSLQARMTGYGAALGLFLILAVCGFIFKQTIVSAWSPAAMIYELAGTPVAMQGEGLVMESLSASLMRDKTGKDVLVLKGRVINLTDHSIDVPPMVAILRSTNGEDGEHWMIDAPVDQVEPGASFAFKSDYPSVPRGVGSVNLTFAPVMAGTKLAHAEVIKEVPVEAKVEGHEEERHVPTPPADHHKETPVEHHSTDDHAAPSGH